MADFPEKLSRRRFVLATTGVAAALALPAMSAAGYAQDATGLPSDLTTLSACRLSQAIKLRQVSCVEVMQSYLQHIDRHNPTYNAIVGMPPRDELLRQAASADRALEQGDYWGWLHGMPHAVKDLSDVKGLATTSGYLPFANKVAKRDHIFVQRMRAQGAIFIGKTNVPEFGLGSQTYNQVYGTTRNAYDPALTAGGSSGGAACALATRMVPVADGSDMMGSLRNPAAYNNVVGFRPSQGRIPHEGPDLFFQQLGYEGPMGRCVEDTLQLFLTLSGFDPRIPMSLREQLTKVDSAARSELNAYRLGWMGDYHGYLPTEPGVLALCTNALGQISRQGAIVEECTPAFDMQQLWQTWLTLRHWTVAAAARPLYDAPDLKRYLKPEAVWEIEGGLGLSGLDIAAASVGRSNWYRALDALFQRYDFLALPTAQVFPFPAEVHWPSSVGGKKMDTYHRWMEVSIGATLSGCPAINLPAGFDDRGRPMGLQFIAPFGQDLKLLAFARQYEANTHYLSTAPELRARS